MTPDEFRSAGRQLVDLIADYLDTVQDRPVSAAVQPGDVRAQLPQHPPTEPEPLEAVIADLQTVILPGLTHWQHPSFFAYFPANTSYPSILADLVTAGIGVQGMSWVTSPAATEVETLMMDWMHELLALPERFRSGTENGGTVIQGSASEATLVAILSARHRAGAPAADQVAYSTSQAHSSIEKDVRIAGLGHLRIVPHDSVFAMRAPALAEMIAADRAAGLTPSFVCATHGTTSSLAFDPTLAIGEICAAEGVWLHVDAAMSGIAALCEEHRWVNDGLEHADSYVTDAHKWLGVGFDASLYWTADRSSLLEALSIQPEYLRSAAGASGALDYRDWQIPLGRRFRALKLWFLLRLDGVHTIQEMIRRHVGLTQALAGWVHEDDRFEIVAPHSLNLLCIALRDDDPDLGNLRTEALIDAANASGEALFTRTVLDGRTVLRFSIGGARTTHDHVAKGWALLQTLATDQA
jgi:aromatic-L-amino-acid decarboxylase